MDPCVEMGPFSAIRPMVQLLSNDLKVGLKQKGIALKDTLSGLLQRRPFSGEQSFDRFKICFELAGDQIVWEIIFNQDFPDAVPDIIFGAGDQEFCPDLEAVEAFQSWNHLASSSLCNLVTEMIEQYLSYQKESLLSLPRLKEDWEDLVINASSYANDCEVHILRNGPGVYNTVVNLMFNLPVDLSSIPAYLTKENPGGDKACLHISFQPPNLNHVQTRLLLSARVEHALGGRDSIRIPTFGNSTILSYVQRLELCLKNTVNEVCQRYEKRKELIATFLSEFPGSVIEYDPEGFYEIILLLQMENSYFIVFVMLGNRYPADPPALVLQSIMHASAQGPYRENRNDFKYSPRWESQKIVEKIREYLVEILPVFQNAAKRY